jgi:hypothetical protein
VRFDPSNAALSIDQLPARSFPKTTAIPWLLLEAKRDEGAGQFHRVTYIQGVNTTGGTAPATTPGQVCEEIRVHYTAEYYFYREALIKPSLRASALESTQARQEVDLPVSPGN